MKKLKKLKILLAALFILLLTNIPVMAAEFSVVADWDGDDIAVSWDNLEVGFFTTPLNMYVTVTHPDGTTDQADIQPGDKTSGTFYLSEAHYTNGTSLPAIKEGDKVFVKAVTPHNYVYTSQVECTQQTAAVGQAAQIGRQKDSFVAGPMPIFTEDIWKTVIYWYTILAALSGVFCFMALVKSGYQYIFYDTSNPGMRASATETLERCLIAIVIIMAAPLMVGFLIQINDALVAMLAHGMGSNAVTANQMGLTAKFEPNMVDKMIAWPLRTIFIDLPNGIFGLHPLSHLIFNSETKIIEPGIFTGESFKLGNPLATVILTIAFAGFNIFFNAVYTIRRWVVIAVLVATPLVVWVWVLSSKREVVELWLSEIFQTIFMQTWHALTFAIVLTILVASGGTPDISYISNNVVPVLLTCGKYVAGFGGVICVGVIIVQSYKIMASAMLGTSSQEMAKHKQKLQYVIVGLVLLSMSLIIVQSVLPESVPILSPTISGGHHPKITVWELFWGIFAVIPISKMLSNIFMSLMARVGTVDEHSAAMKNLGMLSGVMAIAGAMRGKAGIGLGAGIGAGVSNSTPGDNTATPSAAAISPSSGNGSGHGGGISNPKIPGSPSGGSQNFGDNDRGEIFSSGTLSGTSPYGTQNYSDNNDEECGIFPPDSSGSFGTDEKDRISSPGDSRPTDRYAEYLERQKQRDAEIEERQKRKEAERILKERQKNAKDYVSQSLDRSAALGDAPRSGVRKLGMMAGMAVGAPHAVGAAFDFVGGKAVDSLARTASLGHSLYNASKDVQEMLPSLTGRESMSGVKAQLMVGNALSPIMNPAIADSIARGAGHLGDKFGSRDLDSYGKGHLNGFSNLSNNDYHIG